MDLDIGALTCPDSSGVFEALGRHPDPAVLAASHAPLITPAVNFRTPITLRMMEHHRLNPSRRAVIARPVEARDGTVTIVYQDEVPASYAGGGVMSDITDAHVTAST